MDLKPSSWKRPQSAGWLKKSIACLQRCAKDDFIWQSTSVSCLVILMCCQRSAYWNHQQWTARYFIPLCAGIISQDCGWHWWSNLSVKCNLGKNGGPQILTSNSFYPLFHAHVMLMQTQESNLVLTVSTWCDTVDALYSFCDRLPTPQKLCIRGEPQLSL